ncbi:uncharacterized protein ACNLHF_027057 [Anomaloglossus baeobatrachus]
MREEVDLILRLMFVRFKSFFPSVFQICGLILLVLCVVLEYFSPYLPFLQKPPDLVLREIEVVVQEAAEEKRKSYIQSMMSTDLDKLIPGDPEMQGVMLHLIKQYQERVQNGFIAEGEGRGLMTMVQELQKWCLLGTGVLRMRRRIPMVEVVLRETRK